MKLIRTVNSNYVWLLFSSYLFGVIVNLVRFPSNTLFLELGKTSGTSIIVGMLLSFPLFWLLTESKKYVTIRSVNIFLVAFILFFSILKGPSLFMSLGLILLSLILFLFFYLEKEKLSYIFLAPVLLSFPKLLLQTSVNFQDQGLGIFSFTLSDSRLPTLIWSVLISIIIAVLVGIILYKLPLDKASDIWIRRLTVVVLLCGFFYVLYLSVVVYYKVKANAVSSFDIGIFSQMFERMRHDLSQITTLERDGALSHFAVHISPIYYLILPFYMLFPYVETLDIIQNVIVFSGVIPLLLILRKIQLPKLMTPLFTALFFVTPVMTTSGGFHLHENCFLPPLILWLFYGIISQWRWRSLLFAQLLLFVKEDAFAYVISLGLYFAFQNRFTFSVKFKRWLYMITIALPILYFSCGLLFLATHGEGAMVSRYDNLLVNGESGLMMIVKNIILNPLYVMGMLFTPKRLGYIFIVLFSLGFLPVIQKRWATYFLISPLFLINLLTGWPYQHDIGYQYSYGSITLLFLMALLSVDDLSKQQVMKENVLVAFVASCVIFSGSILYSFTNNWTFEIHYYQDRKDYFDGIQSVLDKIPKEKVVLAAGAYTPGLRKNEALYDIFYHHDKKVDSKIDIVVVPREMQEEKNGYSETATLNLYKEAGYKESHLSTKDVLVLEKGH